MDPARAGSYLRFLQDPSAGPSFSHSSTQPVLMFPPPPFAPFCTQPPPPPPAAAPSLSEAPSSSCRSGRRRRVRASPEPAQERTRMFYTDEEDLHLVSA